MRAPALLGLALLLLLAAPPTAAEELVGYMISTPAVAGNTSNSNASYAALFNPAGSGKTIVVKRIEIRTDATAGVTAGSIGPLNVSRINASSGGTLIPAAQIPQKYTGQSNSIAEIRYGAVNATLSAGAGADARIIGVYLPGAVRQLIGDKEMRFEGDEKLVLQPGEGIGLFQEGVADADHQVRLMLEWNEEATPASQGEYVLSTPGVAGNTTSSNASYVSLFNPAGSGKVLVVKRVDIRVDAVATITAGVTPPVNITRITGHGGGTLLPNTSIPKKHTGSPNSTAQIRYGQAINVTSAGGEGTDSRLLGVWSPLDAGQTIGHLELRFGDDEKLVLQEGEGIALRQEAVAEADHRFRMFAEWNETATLPASEGEYLYATPAMGGNITLANYTYAVLFNPASSNRTLLVKRLEVRIDTVGISDIYTLNITRITDASGGTLVPDTQVPRKHTGSLASVAQVRYRGAWVTTAGGNVVDSRLFSIATPPGKTPGAGGELIGEKSLRFGSDAKISLQPGEGIALRQEGTTDEDFRIRFQAEWDEEATPPATEDEYMYATPVITAQSTPLDYVYGSLFNPTGSGRTLVVKRVEVRAESRAPAGYFPLNVTRISSVSGGTGVPAAQVPRKNNSSADSVAYLNHTGPTVALMGGPGANSRIIGVTAPNDAAELIGEKETRFGPVDEKIVLREGEGIALLQNATVAPDPDERFLIMFEWDEETTAPYSDGEYVLFTPRVASPGTAHYALASIMNPSTSGKSVIIRRLDIRSDTQGNAVYLSLNISRINSSTGGTLIPANHIPKKHNGSNDSFVEVRFNGPTVTLQDGPGAASRLLGLTTAGAAGPTDGGEVVGHKALRFGTDEKLFLKPGEGIALLQEAAGNTNLLIALAAEFDGGANTLRLPPNAEPLTNRTVVHKNESITFSANWSDKIGINNTTLEWNATATQTDLNISINNTISGTQNWSNFTNGTTSDFLNVPTGWKRWRQFANNTIGNQNNTTYGYFQMWGWTANTRWHPAAENQTSYGDTLVIDCHIRDKDNDSAIQGYGVHFYKYGNLTGYLGYAATNASGNATYNWVTAGEQLGTYSPTCHPEGYNTTLFYNASEFNISSATAYIWDTRPPAWSGFQPNRSVVHKNETILFSSYWTDNFRLNASSLETNATADSLPRNVTFNTSLTGLTSTWVNYTHGGTANFSDVPVGNKSWRIFANDTNQTPRGNNTTGPPYNTSGLFDLYGWANLSNTTPLQEPPLNGIVYLTCLARDTTNHSNVSGLKVNYYRDTALTVFLGSNETNGTGWSNLSWDTRGTPAGTYNPTCVLETDNTTLYYNATGPDRGSTTITIAQYIAIGLSDGLTWGVSFGEVSDTPASPQAANNSNGGPSQLGNYTAGGNTTYWVNISSDTNVNVTLCFGANNSLKTPSGGASIANSSYRWNTSLVNASGFNISQPPFTDRYPLLDSGSPGLPGQDTLANASNLSLAPPSNHTILFRFGLNITADQATGSYSNKLNFRAVPESQGCSGFG